MFLRLHRFRLTLAASALLAIVSASSALMAQDAPNRGRKYKAPPATSVVVVTVLRATNGKPVENASVIFHPLVNGRNSGNMELKTNDDGQATIDLLETGSNVRVQVIAPGFQTYGEDFKIGKDKMAIDVKLHRPQPQYSLYKQGDAKADAEKPAEKPADPPAAADAAAPGASVPGTDDSKTDGKPKPASTPK